MDIRRRPPNPSIKVADMEYGVPHEDSAPRNILEKIVWQKDVEIELAKKKVPLQEMKTKVESLPKTLGFLNALKNFLDKSYNEK